VGGLDSPLPSAPGGEDHGRRRDERRCDEQGAGDGPGGDESRRRRRAGLETGSRFELAQATEMLRFAAAGLGVTIVPRSLAQGPPAQGAASSLPYRVLELADREAVHPVSVVYQPPRLSAAAREFLAMLALPVPTTTGQPPGQEAVG
jgi:DNA-binding transcriptional LysR family regulator